jgi:hypothetical protein
VRLAQYKVSSTGFSAMKKIDFSGEIFKYNIKISEKKNLKQGFKRTSSIR